MASIEDEARVVRVRQAVIGDWPQFWPLLACMGGVDDQDAARVRFERSCGDEFWLVVVAELGGRLQGYAAAQDYGVHLRAGQRGRIGRLHDVFVEPDQRRTGLGRSLMDAVVDWASHRVAHLQWQAHETRSAPFYERLGHVGSPCPQPDYPEFEISF